MAYVRAAQRAGAATAEPPAVQVAVQVAGSALPPRHLLVEPAGRLYTLETRPLPLAALGVETEWPGLMRHRKRLYRVAVAVVAEGQPLAQVEPVETVDSTEPVVVVAPAAPTVPTQAQAAPDRRASSSSLVSRRIWL